MRIVDPARLCCAARAGMVIRFLTSATPMPPARSAQPMGPPAPAHRPRIGDGIARHPRSVFSSHGSDMRAMLPRQGHRARSICFWQVSILRDSWSSAGLAARPNGPAISGCRARTLIAISHFAGLRSSRRHTPSAFGHGPRHGAYCFSSHRESRCAPQSIYRCEGG